jgi:hypothetical protein
MHGNATSKLLGMWTCDGVQKRVQFVSLVRRGATHLNGSSILMPVCSLKHLQGIPNYCHNNEPARHDPGTNSNRIWLSLLRCFNDAPTKSRNLQYGVGTAS